MLKKIKIANLIYTEDRVDSLSKLCNFEDLNKIEKISDNIKENLTLNIRFLLKQKENLVEPIKSKLAENTRVKGIVLEEGNHIILEDDETVELYFSFLNTMVNELDIDYAFEKSFYNDLYKLHIDENITVSEIISYKKKFKENDIDFKFFVELYGTKLFERDFNDISKVVARIYDLPISYLKDLSDVEINTILMDKYKLLSKLDEEDIMLVSRYTPYIDLLEECKADFIHSFRCSSSSGTISDYKKYAIAVLDSLEEYHMLNKEEVAKRLPSILTSFFGAPLGYSGYESVSLHNMVHMVDREKAYEELITILKYHDISTPTEFFSKSLGMGNIDIFNNKKMIKTLYFIKKRFNKNVLNKVYKSVWINNDLDSIILDNLIKFSKIVKLGSLSDVEMDGLRHLLLDIERKSYSYDNYEILDFFVENEVEMSFVEFKFIFNYLKKDYHYYNKISKLKQSLRLLKLNEYYLFSSNRQFSCFTADEIMDRLGDKPLDIYMKNNNPLKIKDKLQYANYLLINDCVEVKTQSDIDKCVYMLSNNFKLEDLSTNAIDELDSKILNSDLAKNFIAKLNINDDFVNSYRDNIVSFLIKDTYSIFNGFMNNTRATEKNKADMILIAKAILVGKYEDLKFVYGDIQKETTMSMTEESFGNWKRTDKVEYKNFEIADASDFTTIMTIGEVPVYSCMNYKSGAYSSCLLSNFDTSKKILTIRKDGKYVGRAILRLTKMSDSKINDVTKRVSFIDVTSDTQSAVAVDVDSNEQMIVFLEKLYTSLDKNDVINVMPAILEMLKGKTESMGAKLVVSRFYSDYLTDIDSVERATKYVFITESKNGGQYLDSFDGSTSQDYCYKSGIVLMC